MGIALSPNAYCGIKGIPLAGTSRCIGISIEHELRTDFIVREMLLFYIPRARRPCWSPGGGIHRPSSSLELKGYNEPTDMLSVGVQLPEKFRRWRLSEQVIEAVAVERVALAGGSFETVAVDNRDLTLLEADQAGALKLARGLGDASASDAEHRRQELVRHWDDIRGMPCPRHQEPAGATLLDRVETIARGSLCAEVEEHIGEAQKHFADLCTLVECVQAPSGVHPQRGTRDLTDNILRRDLGA